MNDNREKLIDLAIDSADIYLRAHVSRAYDKGYEDGIEVSETARQQGYRDGAEDARKVILNLISVSKKDPDHLTKMFGYNTVSSITENYTIKEISDKFSDFEKMDVMNNSSIRVGDEVRYLKELIIVTSVQVRNSGILVNGICRSDGSVITIPRDGIVKTGNHFDNIRDYLNSFNEEEDDK